MSQIELVKITNHLHWIGDNLQPDYRALIVQLMAILLLIKDQCKNKYTKPPDQTRVHILMLLMKTSCKMLFSVNQDLIPIVVAIFLIEKVPEKWISPKHQCEEVVILWLIRMEIGL